MKDKKKGKKQQESSKSTKKPSDVSLAMYLRNFFYLCLFFLFAIDISTIFALSTTNFGLGYGCLCLIAQEGWICTLDLSALHALVYERHEMILYVPNYPIHWKSR